VPARNHLGERKLAPDKPSEEPVAFDPVLVLRHPPVAASRTVEVSEASVVVSSVAARCLDRAAR
jgi:hypothetical protein